MTTINDRIGSQNVIRVLSNASAPPTRLANLSDVNSTRKTEDGLILVWDLTTERFVLTEKIDSATTIITGISSFSNVTDSTSPATGALKISGGVGIAKNVNIAGGLQVTGLSTFVGVVTTSGDMYVGGDLFVKDDIVYDEVSGRQVNISGIGTFGSIFVGNTEVLSPARQLKNIVSLDAVTTSTIETAISNSPNTFTELNVSGISTFIGIATFASGIIVTSGVSTFTNAIDANGGANITGNLTANSVKVSDLTAGRVVYAGTDGELQDNGNFTFNGTLLTITGNQNVTGTLTAGLIDGGAY
tara:strand:- start:1121 stop:2023 length:903 start_codon:yes stop_codon:yes gene_type:complete